MRNRKAICLIIIGVLRHKNVEARYLNYSTVPNLKENLSDGTNMYAVLCPCKILRSGKVQAMLLKVNE